MNVLHVRLEDKEEHQSLRFDFCVKALDQVAGHKGIESAMVMEATWLT